MPSTIQSLRIQDLQARLGLRQFVCASLALEIDTAQTSRERAALSLRWEEALAECEVLSAAIDLLKREQE